VGDCSQAASLQREWAGDRRWTGVQREHSAADVIRLRGLTAADHVLARRGARRLWELLGRGDAVQAGGAVAGEQAAALVQAGLPVIYLPGRPAAADGNLAPQAVRRVNDAMIFADQVSWPEPSPGGAPGQPLVAPVVADAEAGFGSAPGAFALMTAMIEAGAAGVCFEDRLSSRTERGHRGGKVLVPTGQHIKTLSAARLAADVLNVPSLVMARTCAHEASLLTSDADERDHEFLTGERTAEGFHVVQPGRYARVTRALAFAPYADLLWLETATPNLAEARAFADIIYSQYPHQLLAYSCSPAFDWARLDGASIARFRRELAAIGYLFQYTAPAGSRDKAPSAVLVG
jgi:isocitrate lyase